MAAPVSIDKPLPFVDLLTNGESVGSTKKNANDIITIPGIMNQIFSFSDIKTAKQVSCVSRKWNLPGLLKIAIKAEFEKIQQLFIANFIFEEEDRLIFQETVVPSKVLDLVFKNEYITEEQYRILRMPEHNLRILQQNMQELAVKACHCSFESPIAVATRIYRLLIRYAPNFKWTELVIATSMLQMELRFGHEPVFHPGSESFNRDFNRRLSLICDNWKKEQELQDSKNKWIALGLKVPNFPDTGRIVALLEANKK